MATDAFGRLRISDVFTVHEAYITVNSSDDYDTWMNFTAGTGAISKANIASGYAGLTVSTTGDSATRVTKLPMVYQPGKSRLVYMSSVPAYGGVTGSCTLRIGMFEITSYTSPDVTPSQGVWFESDGTTLYWVEKTSDGTETKVAQSSWNVDTFNGSGPSGVTLTASNIEKNLLIVIDQEWLGVGRIRVGFNLNGVNYYAQQFTHALEFPYTSTPRLPLVYQVISNGGSMEMRQICNTCLSESGFTPLGKRVSVANLLAGVPLNAASTKYILLGLRIDPTNASYRAGLLKILACKIFFPKGNNTQWCKVTIQLHSSNGSVGATSGTLTWNSAGSGLLSQYARGNGTTNIITTDGYIIHSDFINSSAQLNVTSADFETLLTRSQVSFFDTLYVSCEVNATGLNAMTTIDYIESF